MNRVEYNSILSEREFDPDSDKFRRGKKAQTVIDVSGKIVGSVSDGALFDLFGNVVASLESEDLKENGDEKIRVAEYVSDTAHYRLIGDELFAVEGESENLFGRISRKKRNIFHITVLGALAVILIVTIVLIALIGLPSGGTNDTPPDVQPIIEVSDTGGAWQEQKAVAVFDDKILPGSSGEYSFVIANPHDFDMQYSFYIEPKYEGAKSAEFPIIFRLRMNNVIVETDEWRTVDLLRYDELVLMHDSSHSFTLEWRWPFESGSDENDTMIGESGGKISLVLHLTAQAR